MTTSYAKAARYFDKEMVEPLRQQLIGRKLFPKVVNLKPGEFNVDYDTITDMSAAQITRTYPDDNVFRDMIKVEKTNLRLCVLSKGYEVPREDFEAFKTKGKDLDGSAMLSAAHRVGQLEDDLLIQGWVPDGSNYTVSGLYQSAGNDATGSVTSSFGGMSTGVAAAFALLMADDVSGINYNLVLHATQYSELMASRSTNGVREWPDIVDMINPTTGTKGEIYQSSDITVDTALMSPADSAGKYIDLVRAQDFKNIIGEDSKIPDISPIYGTTVLVEVPRIKQANAICKINTL